MLTDFMYEDRNFRILLVEVQGVSGIWRLGLLSPDIMKDRLA
jgi:hypothetical protein